LGGDAEIAAGDLLHGGTTHSQNGPALVQVQEQCVPDGQRVSVRIPEHVQVQVITAVRTGEKFWIFGGTAYGRSIDALGRSESLASA
jgi:hypothetical protein